MITSRTKTGHPAPGSLPPRVSRTLTDDEAWTAAVAILRDPVRSDPRVLAALCRWVLVVDVAGLRRALGEARWDAEVAREDFRRARALHVDRTTVDLADRADTVDDDLSEDGVPVELDAPDEARTSPARRPVASRVSPVTREA